MKTQVCKGDCRRELPLTNDYYDKNPQYITGLITICKECRSKRAKQSRESKNAAYDTAKKAGTWLNGDMEIYV